MKTKKLYRPVGKTEFLLIKKAFFMEFPPRLTWQPIFYPVLNQAYAETIALDWNTKDEFSGYVGIVLEFEVNEAYLEKFMIENVGGKNHNELWIPSVELDVFNQNISGKIKVVNAFFGTHFNPNEEEALKQLHLKFKK